MTALKRLSWEVRRALLDDGWRCPSFDCWVSPWGSCLSEFDSDGLMRLREAAARARAEHDAAEQKSRPRVGDGDDLPTTPEPAVQRAKAR